MLEAVNLHCPYCGESFSSSVDCSAGSQTYVEDCAVCCRPIDVRIRIGNDGEIENVSTKTDRE